MHSILFLEQIYRTLLVGYEIQFHNKNYYTQYHWGGQVMAGIESFGQTLILVV